MQRVPPTAPDTVQVLLRELRDGHYRLHAWARFLARSWRLSRLTARLHPALVRSWRRTAAGLAAATLTTLGSEAALGGSRGRAASRRALPGTLLCLGYTLGDAYVHLGMNHDARQAPGAPLYETLGLPTLLTLTRGTIADVLIGHLLGGAPAPLPVVRGALAGAALTDLADGFIARRLQRTTRLGVYLDSETDFGVGVALTLTVLQRRSLPVWLASAMLARWFVPLGYALVSEFAGARHAALGSTCWGKAAGTAQLVTLGAALLPAPARTHRWLPRRALRVCTVMLLVSAPIAQLARLRRTEQAERPEGVAASGPT